MPIYSKAGATFAPAPAGAHAAVCVDIVDLGILEVTYGGKTKKQHKVKIVWQIDELRDDGRPFHLGKRYTNSLHEKAVLRKDLESWRGKPFTNEELQGFDLEVLLSKGCMINVIHSSANGNTYANVTTVMRGPKGMQMPSPRDYIRECDRQPEGTGDAAEPTDQYSGSVIDDEVPF